MTYRLKMSSEGRSQLFVSLEYQDAKGRWRLFGFVQQGTETHRNGRLVAESEVYQISLSAEYGKELHEGVPAADLETGLNTLLAMYHARANPQ